MNKCFKMAGCVATLSSSNTVTTKRILKAPKQSVWWGKYDPNYHKSGWQIVMLSGIKAVKSCHSPVLDTCIRVFSIYSCLVDDLGTPDLCKSWTLSCRRWLQTKQSMFAVCNSTNNQTNFTRTTSYNNHSLPSPLPHNNTSTEVSHQHVSLVNMLPRNRILNLCKSMKCNLNFCETHLLHPVTHYNTFNTLIRSCRQLRCKDNKYSSSDS